MKHNSDVPGQLALFAIAPTVERTTIHDPYWDEILAPQQEEDSHWNPSDFGEVSFKSDDDGQLTIFHDHSQEPPDPDDYPTKNDYHRAWAEWRVLVGGQVENIKTHVGGQVALVTKKSAHQHDTHWLEKYWVQRGPNKYWYYRYCWREDRRKRRVYIGSVDSILAKRKKADVEVWISDGKSPQEIEKLIHSWRGHLRSQS